MKELSILIKYSGAWHGRFLDGELSRAYNNVNRKSFKKGTKDKRLPFYADISLNTIIGIIYRLSGEQRRLWRILEDRNYLGLSGDTVEFEVYNRIDSYESVALRSIDNAQDPSGFAGMQKKEMNPIFLNSEYYQILCYPLFCTPDELYNLIVNKQFGRANIIIKNRLRLLDLQQKANSIKAVDVLSVTKREQMLSVIKNQLPKTKYQDKDKDNYALLCASAMHMSANYIIEKYDIKEPSDLGWHKGICPRGTGGKVIDQKFMMSGIAKVQTVINYPMSNNFHRKTNQLNKSDGYIDVRISGEDVGNIYDLITKANVGCFNVGKKGIAFVKSMRIGEKHESL